MYLLLQIHEKRDELHKVQETKGMEAMRHVRTIKADLCIL